MSLQIRGGITTACSRRAPRAADAERWADKDSSLQIRQRLPMGRAHWKAVPSSPNRVARSLAAGVSRSVLSAKSRDSESCTRAVPLFALFVLEQVLVGHQGPFACPRIQRGPLVGARGDVVGGRSLWWSRVALECCRVACHRADNRKAAIDALMNRSASHDSDGSRRWIDRATLRFVLPSTPVTVETDEIADAHV